MIIASENILKALSWTLIHSIWQGLILAVLAGLVIINTKKASAAVRYNSLSGLFVTFLAVAAFTFSYEYQQEGVETTTRLNLPLIANGSDQAVANSGNAVDFSTQVIDFLNDNANTIVLLWFFVFCIKCLSVFNDLKQVYRIRNYRNTSPGEYWNEKIEALCRNLNINKKVILLESQLVQIPSVTGYFKPIILVPIGLLSNLPQDQIEAILLHELAHIKRKDYFVNLIQSFAEILFFFNPGVLWLSFLMKEERENCCDDMAVSVTNNKSNFIHALVSFQEYNLQHNQFSLGFGHTKKPLLNRAKRIINNDNKTLNAIEKTFLSVCLLLVAVITIASSNTKSMAYHVEKLPLIPIPYVPKTPLSEAEVTALNRQDEHQNDTDITEQEKYSQNQREADVAQRKAEVVKKKAENVQHQHETKHKSSTSENVKPAKETKVSTYTKQTDTNKDGKRISQKISIKAEVIPNDVDAVSQNIIAVLIAEKVISDTENLSYNLSSKNLIVNGNETSKQVHQKVKKHVKPNISNICYNYSIE